MLTKQNRLSEKEVKRVLQKGAPFFSYNLVSNTLRNNKGFNRFAIVIGGKSVKLAVHRNFLRRRFYDNCSDFLKTGEIGYDIVFVIKKKTVINLKEAEALKTFDKDILFLSKKIFK